MIDRIRGIASFVKSGASLSDPSFEAVPLMKKPPPGTMFPAALLFPHLYFSCQLSNNRRMHILSSHNDTTASCALQKTPETVATA